MANPRMTAEIGRVLGGRYRLVAPIGMGASAQVYLADDVKLRRRVALKMLHDALAGDAEFLRRFRAEARAAAALSHPNIMAVYDWSDGSEEGDVAFIVTEYLPGGSLRSLLDSGALLTPAQALGIGVEAARALDYAHRRGFVHRDVKPANLLFGEDQRLRIADFGLARALAEAAWTEPQGAVLGTARYASPEQAKGERLTGKADVYSLALVLVEAVTGEVPFVADTTLGTLMARVDRQFEAPEALGPLQEVVAAAGNPDPDQRIDARALARGLLRAAQELSRPAPLPLVGALAAGSALAEDLDPTVHAPGPAAAPTDLTSEDLDLDPPAWVNQADPAAGAGGAVLASAAAVAAVGVGAVEAEEVVDLTDDEVDLTDPPSSADEPDEPDGEVSVADAAGLGTPALVGPETEAPAEPVVADDEVLDAPTVGPELDAPTVGAVGAGVPTEAVDAVELGVVAPTLPPVPPPALGGHEPDGPDTHEVEAVGGVEVPAGAAAGGAGGGRRRRKWPWVALAVIVLGGAGVAAAAVATRERPVDAPAIDLPVPELVGRTEAQARAVASAAGWKVTVVHKRQNDSTKGDVLDVSPAAGTRLAEGRTITLTVSDGQEIVDVPADLAGQSIADATAALEAVGLEAEVADTRYDEDVAKDVVIGLADGTPSRLERGSSVPLVVSNGPEPRTVPSGLVGSTEDAAVEALEALGLKAAIVRSYSDDIEEGIVISVLPRSGSTVERGSSVNVEVSRGPELVAVPDVSGASSINEAIAILQAAGLSAGEVSGPAAGSPQGTSPGAGSLVRPGSRVDIILG